MKRRATAVRAVTAGTTPRCDTQRRSKMDKECSHDIYVSSHKRAPDARSLVSPRPRRRRVPTEREPTHTSTKKYTAIGSPHLLEAARSAAGPAPASSPSIAIIHPSSVEFARASRADTSARHLITRHHQPRARASALCRRRSIIGTAIHLPSRSALERLRTRRHSLRQQQHRNPTQTSSVPIGSGLPRSS
jgi:hypothetical protein